MLRKYLIILLFWTLVIGFRYWFSLPFFRNGDTLKITSRVYTDPIIYDNKQYIKIENLRIYLPLVPEISYGDTVVVEGIVDGDKLQKSKLIEIKESQNLLANFRNRLISFYQNTLPEPMAGLISGVILGSKGSLTKEFWTQVREVGVAHVVVASGTNITFVSNFIFNFLVLFFPRRKSIYIVMLSIILYLFISGFDAPLVRAAIMVSSVYIAQLFGRAVDSWKVLSSTALLMLLIKPIWLTDLGFILSFVSTASLMLFESRVRKHLSYLPEIFKEGLSTSLAAQIGVSPILFVTFGQFNIWSPLVNMLVLWTIPFVMVIGAIGGVVGLVIPILGKAIIWLAYPLLWWFVRITEIFNF